MNDQGEKPSVPQDPEEMVAQATARRLEDIAEALPDSEDEEPVITEEAKERIIEISERFDPNENEVERRSTVSDLVNLYNESGDIDIKRFAGTLAKLGFRREDESVTDPIMDAAILKLFPKLTEDQRAAVKAELPVITVDEKASRANIKKPIAKVMNSTMDALGNAAKNRGEEISSQIQERIDDPRTTQSVRERLERDKARVTGLLGRITDFFGSGEPGRDWARRIGKGLYFTLLAIFIIIILEMNLIHKMSRKQR